MENDSPTVKILLLGDSAVGKSSLLLRYTEGSYSDNFFSTIGIDFKFKDVKAENGRSYRLQIWDTAGQDRFRSITKNYYKGAQGLALLYDVGDANSFVNIKGWISSIRELCGDNVPILLVANKIDLPTRAISAEEGKSLALENKIDYIETSVKENINVDNVFQQLVNKISDKIGQSEKNVHLEQKQKKKSKTCCNK